MDANAAAIFAAVLGAIIGGPAGFFIERLVNRPRLKISYAEAAYEDIYTFPIDVQQNLLRFTDFINFVEAQVKWSIRQRIVGNLFNREELRLIRDFGQHFAELQQKGVSRIQNELLPALAKGDDVDRLAPELEGDYQLSYGAILSNDLAADRATTIRKLAGMYNLMLKRVELGRLWLDDFLTHTDAFLKEGRGTSERVIIRTSIGNAGYQDAIIKTEARLQYDGKTFKTPMQTASRPWESSEARGPSQFYVINPKAFLVLEFLLDENLNAKADLDQLKKDLRRGVNVELQTVGIGGATATSHAFLAQLG